MLQAAAHATCVQQHTKAARQEGATYRAGHVQKVGQEGCSVVAVHHCTLHAGVEGGGHLIQSSIVHHAEVGCLSLYHTKPELCQFNMTETQQQLTTSNRCSTREHATCILAICWRWGGRGREGGGGVGGSG